MSKASASKTKAAGRETDRGALIPYLIELVVLFFSRP
jgi:hypothetical protein